MARDTSPQCKQCRREGQKLFLKGERCFTDKCGVERRSYPPGDHGRGRLRQSEYRVQLREKQKTRRYYQVLEKQFRAYYDKASRQDGVTGENLLRLLESALRQRPGAARFRRLAPPGPPADQPRPLDDQRPPRRHPLLPGASRGHHLDQGRTRPPPTRSGGPRNWSRPSRPGCRPTMTPSPPRSCATPSAPRSRRRSRSSSSSSCTPSSPDPEILNTHTQGTHDH